MTLMSKLLIACETISDELNKTIRDISSDIQILWVESGLHNTPKKLHERLQKLLESLSGYDTVLMAFGLCGNSIVGLETGGYQIIIPKVDDYISLLLGSAKKRDQVSAGGTYFLTKGWMRGEQNIWVEYKNAVKRYGQETAEQIMTKMFGHYEYLALLDTDSYNIDTLWPEVIKIAGKFNLKPKVIPASVRYLRDLLTGPWDDDRFLTVPPYSQIENFPI